MTLKNTSKRRPRTLAYSFCALVLMLAVGANTPISAQSAQQVIAAPSLSASPIHQLDFGVQGEASDDCFFAEMQNDGASATAPSRFDLRLNPCQGRSAIHFVSGYDSAEVGFPVGSANKAPVVRIAYADVNANGAYDLGDHVYLTSASEPYLAPTSGGGFTIRLTEAGGKPAGSLALPGDSDIVSYGTVAKTIVGSLAWVNKDHDSSLSDGDSVYLLRDRAAGLSAGQPVPAGSLLLRQGPQVAGSPPVVMPVTARDSLAVSPLHRLDFGEANDVSSDCFYAELQSNGAAALSPTAYDLRLVGCQGQAEFSFVKNEHADEASYPDGPGNTAPTVRVAYADANGNGYRDASDPLYLTSGPAPYLHFSSSNTVGVRLTATHDYAAGSRVYGGAFDAYQFQNSAPTVEASYAWSDLDQNGALSDADAVYLLLGVGPGYPANSPIPQDHLRLRAGPQQTPTPTATGSTPTATTPTPMESMPTATTAGSGEPAPTATVTVTATPAMQTTYTVPGQGLAAGVAALGVAAAAAATFRRRD